MRCSHSSGRDGYWAIKELNNKWMPDIRNVIFRHTDSKSWRVLKKGEISGWGRGLLWEGGKNKVLDHHLSLLKRLWIPFQPEWRPSLWSRTTSKFSGLPSGKQRDSPGPLWIGSGRPDGSLASPASLARLRARFVGKLTDILSLGMPHSLILKQGCFLKSLKWKTHD